eukprot:TRINITY_DN1491_c0_g1_i2.p2 TRINITY_DN1491_c0_g1~~TRINITY_DN1491_c0_g1_i2.p2  ORF type:complete len:325 (+),score=55.77 TRINITY_DN1491_c0_g1_i2:2-976(+)
MPRQGQAGRGCAVVHMEIQWPTLPQYQRDALWAAFEGQRPQDDGGNSRTDADSDSDSDATEAEDSDVGPAVPATSGLGQKKHEPEEPEKLLARVERAAAAQLAGNPLAASLFPPTRAPGVWSRFVVHLQTTVLPGDTVEAAMQRALVGAVLPLLSPISPPEVLPPCLSRLWADFSQHSATAPAASAPAAAPAPTESSPAPASAPTAPPDVNANHVPSPFVFGQSKVPKVSPAPPFVFGRRESAAAQKTQSPHQSDKKAAAPAAPFASVSDLREALPKSPSTPGVGSRPSHPPHSPHSTPSPPITKPTPGRNPRAVRIKKKPTTS